MNTSRHKLVKNIGEYPGLTIDEIVEGKHIKIYLSTPAGPKVFTAPRSHSDRRAELNNRSLFNNWSKGINK